MPKGPAVNVELNQLQKRLCDLLQSGLPLCRRPFEAIASSLDTDEAAVLREVSYLRSIGIIRRLGPMLDYRVLGKVSTLVTAHVDSDSIDAVAGVISSLSGVSHNYLRQHHYNLWFTLQADSMAALDDTVTSLSSRLGVVFHSMPAIHFFKLDVRFPISGPSAQSDTQAHVVNRPVAVLTESEKESLMWLQNGLDVTSEPFSSGPPDVLKTLRGLLEKGVIRRIAASLDYRRLGFVANAMFCARVSADNVLRAGASLACVDLVSHCYERRTFPGWDLNLFAMMHARSYDDIDASVRSFAGSAAIKKYELLPTVRELKKSPVIQTFP